MIVRKIVLNSNDINWILHCDLAKKDAILKAADVVIAWVEIQEYITSNG